MAQTSSTTEHFVCLMISLTPFVSFANGAVQASAAVIPAAPSCAPLPNEDAARLSSAGVDALAAHHAPRAGSKIMYVQPLGNLEDRLQAVASAATLASRRDVDFVIVWPEHGDEELPAGWKDLYQSKVLTVIDHSFFFFCRHAQETLFHARCRWQPLVTP
jgi:hypothetical protein